MDLLEMIKVSAEVEEEISEGGEWPCLNGRKAEERLDAEMS